MRSQQRAAKAAAPGYFAEEIIAVEAPGGKAGPVVVEKNEQPGLSAAKSGIGR